MNIRRTLTFIILFLAYAISLWGQGMMITVSMKRIKRSIDERFVIGRFFWKPLLPSLFKSGKAGLVPAESRKFNFAPPFLKAKEKH